MTRNVAYAIIGAWQRLIDGTFVKADLIFLQHEFIESLIMGNQEVSWRIAHDIVNKDHNWDKLIKK